MRSKHVFIATALAAVLLNGATRAARADGWVGSWGASDVFPVGQDINYQTLREFVRLSAGGKEARVRFSNATGAYPLVIGAAHVAKPAAYGRQEQSIQRPTMRLPSAARARSRSRPARRRCQIRSKWISRRYRRSQ